MKQGVLISVAGVGALLITILSLMGALKWGLVLVLASAGTLFLHKALPFGDTLLQVAVTRTLLFLTLVFLVAKVF